MNIGLIGLGKMGANLALQMKDKGYEPIVYNRSSEKTLQFIEQGFKGVFSIEEMVDQLPSPRVIWLMVPSGETVDFLIDQLIPLLNKEDLVVDGGNSNYKDTIRRAEKLSGEGLRFMDVGTSGGTSGARNGACMMVGGTPEDYALVEPMLTKLCVPGGIGHMGKSGSGHFVKMIHNGIEYGMMQAIAEGFDILKASPFELDLAAVSEVWGNGSIIASYLIDVTTSALQKNPEMVGIADKVDSSGEGLWSLEAALELGIPAYVLSASLFKRYESKQGDRYTNKLLAAMRNEFGGHAIHRERE